jgi:hypothetical protein
MSSRPVDWQQATLVGAIAGGGFWGLAVGALVVAKVSAIAVAAVCVVAAVVVTAGVLAYRRSTSPTDRSVGIGLILAPLTGLAPVLAVCSPSLLIAAISWKG